MKSLADRVSRRRTKDTYVRGLIEQLRDALCPDMDVHTFERLIYKTATIPKDEPERHPLDVRNTYELGN